MNRPRYQVMQFLYDGLAEIFNTEGACKAEAKNRCNQRPLSVQVIQRDDGDYIALYINGQRFVPDRANDGR